MKFAFAPIRATFLERPNRYIVIARLDSGEVVTAHCADPGRLAELLLPGATVWLSASLPSLTRKTAWDLRFVEHPEVGTLISLDTRVPNRIFEEGLRAGFFPHFAGHILVERERALPILPSHHGDNGVNPQHAEIGVSTAIIRRIKVEPHSRIDFRLTYGDGRVEWVEVKSASLVVDGEARFPDAVTARGARHLGELAATARRGESTSVVFIVQRPDATSLVAHRATDPAFADALVAARAAGVRIFAATCRVTLSEISLEKIIPAL